MPEPHRFAVMLVSLWVERDGRTVARVSEGSDRNGNEAVRVVGSLPELLDAVGHWAEPFLGSSPASTDPTRAR